MWKALASFEGRSSLRSWLYSVVTHACLDAARRRGRRALQRARAVVAEKVPHLAWAVNVLTLRGDRIAGITSFLGREQVTAFGLPAELP